MAFICRKPFTHQGTKYRPGDEVANFPENFFRAEGFIRTGFIVEKASVPALVAPVAEAVEVAAEQPKQKRKKSTSVAEEVTVVEEEPLSE